MDWWGWMVIGILLLAAELFAVDAQFYLVFLGAGALAVGLTLLLGIDLPSWAQWVAFAVISIAFMVTVRRKLYLRLRGEGDVEVGTSAVGQTIRLREDLAPGASCRIEFRGTTWQAVNSGDVEIPAGGSARIETVDGLTLHVSARG